MDPYKILGVTNDATEEEVQQAYREQARKYHPDLGGDTWAFQQVQEAYDTIISDRGAKSRSRETCPSTSDQSTNHSFDSCQQKPYANWFWHMFFGQLPLQNETTTFILANALDIFITYLLLRFGAIEANPVANFFFDRWGFNGMIFFKMGMVAFVTILAQVIARYEIRSARRLLQFGTLVVGIVVVYSLTLFVRNFH